MRYHVLISYDICNPKRLQKVHRIVSSNGQPLQYSVYISQLSEMDFAMLREKLNDTINHREDKIVMIRLSPVVDGVKFERKWTVLGRKLEINDKNNFIC